MGATCKRGRNLKKIKKANYRGADTHEKRAENIQRDRRLGPWPHAQ
jgi:hypothetical protein